jgi:hypothetical protein
VATGATDARLLGERIGRRPRGRSPPRQQVRDACHEQRLDDEVVAVLEERARVQAAACT